MNAAAAVALRPRVVLPAATAGVGRAAVVALYDELALAPKPGLVSFADSGSHRDMDARTFMRSLFALRRAFPGFAVLGAQDMPFEWLEHEGILAEARMLQATGGINTHRGAIFTLGLLCACAGRLLAEGRTLDATSIRRTLLVTWGEALAQRAHRPRPSNGACAARRHGLRSAGVEAALGFPALFETAWPTLRDALARGMPEPAARLDTLFATMAVLDDTNLVHRGGIEALHDVQRAAAAYLAAGGSARPDALAHARSLHRAFVRRRLSPGGSADVLAAACWLQRVCAATSAGAWAGPRLAPAEPR
ncbi:MAG: triphosphoribosyl-dephospho-CoA synthase MdcB [Burkholderiales bacterium]|nr:triphosphoribosyl-dephospho-CoA synthase MdcB [Burkholderiales bacterium]